MLTVFIQSYLKLVNSNSKA